MPSLWSVEDENANLGYRNLCLAEYPQDQEIREALDVMWAGFEPYADSDFIRAFSHDPEARFWELFLGYSLLQDGRELLPEIDRRGTGGLPDICVLDGDRRVWIEAIAPGDGDDGPDQVVRPIPINEGGGVIAAPERQVQLRVTSALYTKSQAFARYTERGVVGADDVRIVAIGAGRFGSYASDAPLPSALRSVFPIGQEFVRVNIENMEVIEQGREVSWEIQRDNGPIARTAFLTDEYAHISGVIWARASIGNFDRAARPLTIIHNPMSHVAMPQDWSVWDREYVATEQGNQWNVRDIRSDVE